MTGMDDFYREWVPSNALEPWVAKIWSWDGPVPDSRAMRFLPSGAAQLFFSFSKTAFESRQAGCDQWQTLSPFVFIGPQFSYFDMSIKPMTKMAGVIFKPGGTVPFFQGETRALVDQLLPLDALWPGEEGCPPGFLRLSDPFDAPALLGDWLLQKLNRPSPREKVLRDLPLWDGKVSRVDALSSRFDLSTKRLAKVFQDLFGVHPKRFARVRRFNLALKEIFEQRNRVLVDVADEVGCFDQPHLNREFRLFSGLSPAEYLAYARTLYYFPLPDRLNEPA